MNAAPTSPKIDTSERGATRDGQPQTMDRRLFMQLQVFRLEPTAELPDAKHTLDQKLAASKKPFVCYADATDPRAVGILTWSTEPAHFVGGWRNVWCETELAAWKQDHRFTMFGRTYSSGYEPDLQYWLIDRPVQTATNEKWPWAVWYPLRRKGEFEMLDSTEQRKILGEHAMIGRAYGEQDLAHDVRLACHGLDTDDNEFVIGLIGEDLYPLSHVVQHMRKTRQTREFIAKMGPFFIGHVRTASNGA